MGRCKPLGSLNSFLLYAPQLFGAKSSLLIVYILNSLFTARGAKCRRWLLLASPQAPAITVQGGGICWIAGIVFPFDCSPPSSSAHGIFQARILEWVAISFSRASPNPGIEPVSPVSPEFQADSLPTEPFRKPPMIQ